MSNFNSADIAAFKDVWVFCEQREGKLMPTDFELISKGRDLANELGVNLCGLLLGGEGIESAAKELGGYGADKVIVCETLVLSLLLFTITCLTELFLHGTALSFPLILRMFLQYLSNGIGVFFAVSPLIAFCAFRKNGQWAALIVTEIYSIGGLFAAISDPYRTYYPIAAIFQFSGYYPATLKNRLLSVMILISCGMFTFFFLWMCQKCKREDPHHILNMI